MALPPTPMPAAAPMGAPADPAAAPAGDMPMDGAAEEGAEPEVVATILKKPGGGYMLIAGDEPEPGMEGEEGAEAAPEGKSFDTPQALLKGVMELLNPTEGAEASFGKAFRGEADDTAMKPPAGPMA